MGMDELVDHWTVLDDERDLVLEKRGGAQRLGFALVLKFYTRHGRFPRGRAEFSDEVSLTWQSRGRRWNSRTPTTSVRHPLGPADARRRPTRRLM